MQNNKGGEDVRTVSQESPGPLCACWSYVSGHHYDRATLDPKHKATSKQLNHVCSLTILHTVTQRKIASVTQNSLIGIEHQTVFMIHYCLLSVTLSVSCLLSLCFSLPLRLPPSLPPSQFKRPFSRWIWVSRYQNVSILDFTGAKDDGGGEW